MHHPQTNFITISKHNCADVVLNKETNQKALIITKSFKKDDVLCTFFAGTTTSIATYLTIQVSINEHITLNPHYLQYCNHSCNPNVFFDTTNYKLVAIKNIEVGNELTFFYPSSEWNMIQEFNCNCGNDNCLHKIQGAANISTQILANYRLTDFIQSMLNK